MSAVIDLHVPDLEARILPGLEAVEDRLHRSVSDSRDLVTELTSHLAQAGGKRMRPLLTLVAAQFGDPQRALSDEVLTAATGIELTHLASLYHDDVMDSAPTRRGVPSAQHLWGNNRAILAGDILFARASAMIATLGDETVRHHAVTFERLCMGQLNETFGPEEGDDPLTFYLQVLADKTGSLVASAAAFGAMHAGADEATIEALTQFGERLGVAFQIADDGMAMGPAEGQSGKTPGTDLREGVDTLPVLLLRRAQSTGNLDPEGQKILSMLSGDLSSDEALAALVARLREHQVVAQTRELAHEWCESALECIADLPEGEAKQALIAFAHLMVDRVA